MFCSKLVRVKRPFLSMKSLVGKMDSVRQINPTGLYSSTRFFSTIPIKPSEGESEPQKRLIEKRYLFFPLAFIK